jgi:hypothetical protein
MVKARAAIKGPKAQAFHVATGVSLGKWSTSEDGRYKKRKKKVGGLRQVIVDLDAELMEEGRSLTFCFLRLHASQA